MPNIKQVLNNSNIITKGQYFIRLTNNKKAFFHLLAWNDDETNDMKFIIKESVTGACMFKKQDALNVIKESGASNLEIVSAIEILGNDGTLN